MKIYHIKQPTMGEVKKTVHGCPHKLTLDTELTFDSLNLEGLNYSRAHVHMLRSTSTHVYNFSWLLHFFFSSYKHVTQDG